MIKALAYCKINFLVVLICNKCVSLVSVLCIKWKLMYIFFYIYNYVFHEQGWSWYTWYTYFLIARDTFGIQGCNEGYLYFSFNALLLECVPASLLYFYFSFHYLLPSEFWPSSPSFSLWCPELLFKYCSISFLVHCQVNSNVFWTNIVEAMSSQTTVEKALILVVLGQHSLKILLRDFVWNVNYLPIRSLSFSGTLTSTEE